MPLPTITDFLYPLQWNLGLMNVQDAWNELYAIDPDIAFGDPNIIIAVIDTGIQSVKINGVSKAIHPDFSGDISSTNTPKVVAFYESIANGFDNEQPLESHGASVASIISGSINGQGTVGVAPNTRLISIIKGELVPKTLSSEFSETVKWSAGLINFHGNILGEGASIVNFSNTFVTEDDYNKSNKAEADKSLQKVYDGINDVTSLGRFGLGILFFAGSGNGVKNPISNQNEAIEVSKASKLASYKKVIAVGATKYTASSSNATPTESIADYSNFGTELEFVAPAGIPSAIAPGSNFFPNKTFTTFAASNFNGGNCPGNGYFQLTLRNNITSSNNDAELRVDSLEGIFPGQSILIHSSNSFTNNHVDILIVKDTQTDTGTPPNKIITTPIRFDHSNGDIISIATQLTKLQNAANSGDSTLFVENTFGFYITQNLIIGNPSGQHESIIISGINPVNNTLTISGTLTGNYASGNIVISKTKVEVQYTDTFGGNSILSVTDNQGFSNGQRIGIEVPTKNVTLYAGNTVRIYEEFYIKRSFTNNSGDKLLFLNKPITPFHSPNSTIIRGRYGHWNSEFSGTSAATPFASGVAALILSAKPLLNWLEVRNILRTTADKIGSLSYTPPGPLGRNDYYCYGRINANNAVIAAKNYSFSSRDLMVRDNPGDLGGGPSVGPIDSPDIWVSNDVSINLPDPPNYNTSGPHQNPNLSVNDKKIYVRVKNIGLSLSSLEGMEVRCLIAITNQTNPTFPFPKYWQDWKENSITGSPGAESENVIYLDSTELPEVSYGGDHIAKVLWKAEKDTAIKIPQGYSAYLLVHITPFDGGNISNTVQSNNNLTYKPLTFSSINFNIQK